MKAILIAFPLFAALMAYAETPSASCEVVPSWSIKGGPRSAKLSPIGRFTFQVEKDGKASTVRSFTDPEENLVVTTALDFRLNYDDSKLRPLRIDIAITVADQERSEIFESVESAEAATRYAKNWNVRVTKSIFLRDRTYMYTFQCWDSRTPRPVF